MAPQLIVALDVPSAEDAERLVDQLYELDVIVKVGLEALCGYPERIFSYCEARDVRTFVERQAARHPANGRRGDRAARASDGSDHQRSRAWGAGDDAHGGRRRRRTSGRARP